MSGTSSGSGSGNRRRIVGFTIKKRIITLPNTASVGPQFCETITEPCDPCDGSGSGGSGSGSGGGGTIETDCCPGLLLPETITGTFTGKSGFASSWPASAGFTYDPINQYWSWDSGILCGDANADLQFKCVGGSWGLYSGVNRVTPSSPTAPTSVSCDPFVVEFTVNMISAYCGAGSYTVTFTI